MPNQLTIKNLGGRKYIKINVNQREALKKLVFKKGQTIKNAAEILNIKYATAKSIINKCRKLKIKKNRNIDAWKFCQFREITRNLIPKLNLVTYVGGSMMSNNLFYLL